MLTCLLVVLCLYVADGFLVDWMTGRSMQALGDRLVGQIDSLKRPPVVTARKAA